MPLPLMPILGLAATGIQAAVQGGQNRKLKQDYLKAEGQVQPIDPMQTALIDRFRRQGQHYRAGTDAASAFAKQNVNNATAQTQSNMVRAGMNNPSTLLRAQQAGNLGHAQVAAQSSRLADGMLALETNMTNLVADKVYQRQREMRNQALARYEQGRQDLNNMVSGMIGTLPDIAAGFGSMKRAPVPERMTPRPIQAPMGAPLPYTPIGG